MSDGDDSPNVPNVVTSNLEVTKEVMKAVKLLFSVSLSKRLTDFEFVYATACLSYEVNKELPEIVGDDENEKSALSIDDALAWSRVKRGGNDARGDEIKNKKFLDIVYSGYFTAIALEHLPDWIRHKCSVLEDKAEVQRGKETDAAEEKADEYDNIRKEFKSFADKADGCADPAAALRSALEEGNLDDAVEALENGDFFLDIGAV